MADFRVVGPRARALGAGYIISALIAGCASAGSEETHRVKEPTSGPTFAGSPGISGRPLLILPRGVLSLGPCSGTGAGPGCSTGDEAGSTDARAASSGDAGTLLAKSMEVRAGGEEPAAAPPPAPVVIKEKSTALGSGFYNPMPGGVFAGYRADTGLDIAGSPRPVYAIAAGTLDYSEPGHTLWTGPKDTANCVRFKLDTPIPWKGRLITHVYYAHLSKLEYSQAEGSTERRRIEAGERLGVSGVANHSPHLHIGLLLDGEVEQYWGTFLLEDEIRQVLGSYRNGTHLPGE